MKMRSHLIFGALAPIQNRYLLCQLVAKSTRKFHRPNTRIQDTTNEVLARFAAATEPSHVMSAVSERLAETQRKAA